MLSESYTSFCVAVTCFSAIHSRQAHSISTPLNFRLRLQQLDCNPEHGALTLLLQNGALTLCTDRSRRQAVHMELRAILVIALASSVCADTHHGSGTTTYTNGAKR